MIQKVIGPIPAGFYKREEFATAAGRWKVSRLMSWSIRLCRLSGL
jgi:hypothetical protein